MDAELDPIKNKGKAPERNSDGRPINLPGVYVHKDNGAKFITSEGDEGVAQADALMQPLWEHAWERTGDVPSRTELLKMRKEQEIQDAASEALLKGEEAAELKAATKAAIEKVKNNVTEAALT